MSFDLMQNFLVSLSNWYFKKLKPNYQQSFEVHHGFKPKSIHVDVIFLSFQFQKFVACNFMNYAYQFITLCTF
jgi:hypothetical protein